MSGVNKPVMDRWMDVVTEQWLNYRDKPKLRPSTKNLLGKLQQMTAQRSDGVWMCIAELEQLHHDYSDTQRNYSKELAQTYVECAIAAYKMGNLHEAIRIFGGALSNCNEAHDKAAIRWLRGCVHWCMGNSINALRDWEDALNIFKEQELQVASDARWCSWYEEVVSHAIWTIEYAAFNERMPSYDEVLHVSKKVKQAPGATENPSGEPAAAAEDPSATTVSDYSEDILRMFTIVDEIPAGGFGAVGIESYEIGRLEINKVLIDNQPYFIRTLRNESSVGLDLASGQRYFVLKVIGDSMNREGIEIGDYVLLRIGDAPNSGDIVAAEITDEDSMASLKKFVISSLDDNGRPDVIILQPNSTNPDHQPHTFQRAVGFSIRGIALAVLKKTG